jgi:microcystin degradation protein MlrC
MGGMLDAARHLEATVIPALHAIAEPSGTIASETYRSLKEGLLETISDAMPLDAVALDLHGAGVAVGVDDVEGDLAASIRRLVGSGTPIVAGLDLHGNITSFMAQQIDLMLGYHFYPHTDTYDRGLEMVSAIPALLDGSWRPTTRVAQLPMLVSWSWTGAEPARSVNELCWRLERERSLIDCTFFHGFPMADVPDAGSSVVVTTNGDPLLAAEVADLAARFVWDQRESFQTPLETPDEGVRRALTAAARGGVVVINESSDNPGGGAPGDGTHLLRALLAQQPVGACFGYVYDPEVAMLAHRSGAGATIDVDLGGKCGELQGEPLHVRAYVKVLTDGRFTHSGPVERGVSADLGPMARLQVDGVDILVGSRRQQTLDPELFLLHGVDVARCRVIALKSSVHFRAAFAEIAREIISVDSPGLTARQIAAFPRKRAGRPLWPLDLSASF